MNTHIKMMNQMISEMADRDKEKLSDWYHTFGELYEHRCVLYIALINQCTYIEELCIWYNVPADYFVFKKSKKHFDWSSLDGWFIARWYVYWWQISYHLPMKYRDVCNCDEQEKADEQDWHTSQDVLDRLLLV